MVAVAVFVPFEASGHHDCPDRTRMNTEFSEARPCKLGIIDTGNTADSGGGEDDRDRQYERRAIG